MNTFVLLLVIVLLYVFVLSPMPQNQLVAHDARALVITCMDFRLIDDAVYFLNSIGYNNNYDQIILAGASLGYNQNIYECWGKTVDDHIGLAKQLHNIQEIIVIDHMQCGAYKLLNNLTEITREDEIRLHRDNFCIFRQKIGEKYPNLAVSTYLMDINGQILPLQQNQN